MINHYIMRVFKGGLQVLHELDTIEEGSWRAMLLQGLPGFQGLGLEDWNSSHDSCNSNGPKDPITRYLVLG